MPFPEQRTGTKETGFFTEIKGLNQVFWLKNPVSDNSCVSPKKKQPITGCTSKKPLLS